MKQRKPVRKAEGVGGSQKKSNAKLTNNFEGKFVAPKFARNLEVLDSEKPLRRWVIDFT